MDVERIWTVLDAQVASGHYPGYVAGIRAGGRVHVHAGGGTGLGGPPVRPDTLFRIASVTKPIGGALTLRLAQEGVLGLDDPISAWLPELAGARVLRSRDAPLDDTVPAVRPVTVRHLLAGTSGWGVTMENTPRQQAMLDRGVHPGPLPPDLSPAGFLAGFAEIPLAFQPGEGWLYDSGIDLLGVLIARAAGKPLPDVLAERVLRPLGMAETGFWAVDPGRLATAYTPVGDELEVLDPPDGVFAAPPRFAKLSGGLVSTVGDVLGFFCAMADGGAPVLDPASRALLTTDQLDPALRAMAEPMVDEGRSWALGTGLDVAAARPWMAPGRWGWTGGTGCTADVDPTRGVVAVLLTQRAMAGPLDSFEDFWTAVGENDKYA